MFTVCNYIPTNKAKISEAADTINEALETSCSPVEADWDEPETVPLLLEETVPLLEETVPLPVVA